MGPSRRRPADPDAHGVRATLPLVPGPWRGARLPDDPALVRWLHAARERGHELALHGYAHEGVPGGPLPRRWANAVPARGCAEFCGLDEPAASARLRAGPAALASAGIGPEGFTPPGWPASPGAVAALRGPGLEYTTSVRDPRTGARQRMVALSHRPGGAGRTGRRPADADGGPPGGPGGAGRSASPCTPPSCPGPGCARVRRRPSTPR
ncbi:DUF2334 domain-containing protein [Streptomyces sp. NPDC049577]|uniref:DUF2334 domain-containing protein n=1 Tax=Streptomyces sp. NPDC049577 TaxID=3155153 RepID=UPI00342C659F